MQKNKARWIQISLLLFFFTISIVPASFLDWLGDELADKAAEILLIDKIINAINIELQDLQTTYNLYYDLFMSVVGEITTLQDELCEKHQEQYEVQETYDDAVDTLSRHKTMYDQSVTAVQDLWNQINSLSPSDPRRAQLISDMNYWIGVRDYHKASIPTAKTAVSNAKTALDAINTEVSELEFEIRIREPRKEEHERAMTALYNVMKPKLEEKAKKEAEIRRIVNEVIQEHIKSHHGENETPHTHSRP